MSTQQAKDEAAKQLGYKDFSEAVRVLGIKTVDKISLLNAIVDTAMKMYRAEGGEKEKKY